MRRCARRKHASGATGSMRPPPRNAGRFASRKALMDVVGASQFHQRLAWCGVNHKERKVYFSMWTDRRVENAGVVSYTIQELHWGVDAQGRKDASRKDHDKKLALVQDDGYEAWGYLIGAGRPGM